MLTFVLPYPPSGNHMWKHTRSGKHYITDKAQAYYDQVAWTIKAGGLAMGLDQRLEVVCEIHPPDKRRRDMDNAWKVISDSLTRAGVWVDDTQIDHLTLIRKVPVKQGLIRLCVGNYVEKPLSC